MNSTSDANSKGLALIIGGSRGIGAAIAEKLACDGLCVGVGYTHDRAGAEKLVLAATQKGQQAAAVQIDYRSRQTIREGLKYLTSRFGKPVSVLINNGAIAQEKPFESLTDEDWQEMMRVNLQGPFAACQEVLPSMIENGGGRIVNISSIGGQWGGVNQVHYAASKAGLINLTRSLAKLYSHQGILTNAIAIGLVATEMTADELSREDGLKKLAAIPIGRIAEAREVADAVSFLVSDQGAYLTGQTLNLNGGLYFG